MPNLQKIFTWLPRVLALMLFAFYTLFTFDEPVLSIGFLIHNIPGLIILAATAVAWKKPLIGSIIFDILGIVTIFFFNTYRETLNFLTLSLPFFIVSGLFIVDWVIKKNKTFIES
jgi:hypothetical protein